MGKMIGVKRERVVCDDGYDGYYGNKLLRTRTSSDETDYFSLGLEQLDYCYNDGGMEIGLEATPEYHSTPTGFGDEIDCEIIQLFLNGLPAPTIDHDITPQSSPIATPKRKKLKKEPSSASSVQSGESVGARERELLRVLEVVVEQVPWTKGTPDYKEASKILGWYDPNNLPRNKTKKQALAYASSRVYKRIAGYLGKRFEAGDGLWKKCKQAWKECQTSATTRVRFISDWLESREGRNLVESDAVVNQLDAAEIKAFVTFLVDKRRGYKTGGCRDQRVCATLEMLRTEDPSLYEKINGLVMQVHHQSPHKLHENIPLLTSLFGPTRVESHVCSNCTSCNCTTCPSARDSPYASKMKAALTALRSGMALPLHVRADLFRLVHTASELEQ